MTFDDIQLFHALQFMEFMAWFIEFHELYELFFFIGCHVHEYDINMNIGFMNMNIRVMNMNIRFSTIPMNLYELIFFFFFLVHGFSHVFPRINEKK